MRLNRLLASFCLLVATFGLASSQPSPGGKGPRTIRERSEALKVDLKEPPAGLVRNPQFYTKSTDENVPLHYTLDGDASWVWWCEWRGRWLRHRTRLRHRSELFT